MHAIQNRVTGRKYAKKLISLPSQSKAPLDHQPVVGLRSSTLNNLVDAQQYVRCNSCGLRHRKNHCRVANDRFFGCGVIGHVSIAVQTRQLNAGCGETAKVHTVKCELEWVSDVKRGGKIMALSRSVEEDYYVNNWGYYINLLVSFIFTIS